jgi:serine/threonine-protein kinase
MKFCTACGSEYGDEVLFCNRDGTPLRPSGGATADLVGQVIADRYHIQKKLGEGGMGQVYLAEHVKMGRRSAIKVMSPSMVHDPDAVARFNREAANASRITHPNVCAVYDFGETPDGLIYLAMEFVEGEPLTGLLSREGELPPARATAIFKQTADALQAAHDLGIVHRDLKPDNIMIARGRDGSDQVKVVDFGIAKAVGGDETGQKVTKTGLVVGTPEFMSPEQLSGDKVDGRSDLYSLALVYFRMLTGQLPFQAETVQETMIKRLTDEPAKLGATRPDLTFPTGLQEVLDAALVRTPAERYQTVAKFAEDVVGVVQLRRPTRGAATPGTRTDMEDRTQLLDSKQTKARASVRRPGTKRSMIPIVAAVVLVFGAAGGGYMLLKGGAATPGPGDSTRRAALPDSTKMAIVPPPDSTKRGTNPVGQTGNTQTSGTHESTITTRPPRPAVDIARASDLLDDLFNRLDAHTMTATVAKDSAEHIYNAPGVARTDQAFAAYVMANAFAALDDQNPGQGHKATALRWAQQAVTLNPVRAYTQLVHDLSGQP